MGQVSEVRIDDGADAAAIAGAPRVPHDGPRPSTRAILTAVAGMAALSLTWTFGLPAIGAPIAPHGSELAQGILNCTLQLVGAVLLARGAAVQRGRRRVAWSAIAAGAFIGGAGSIVWTAIMVTTGLHPTGDLVNGMYATALAFTTVGVALLPPSEQRSRRVRWVDTAILMVAALTLVWAAPLHQQSDGSAIAGFPTVSVFELVTVTTILVAVGALARSRPDRYGEVAPMAGALASSGVAMLLYAASPQGYPVTSRLADGLFCIGFVLAAATGLRLRGPRRPLQRRGSDHARHWLGLPEVATVATLVALTLRERDRGTSVTSLVLGTLVVALAMVRLTQLSIEQRRLGDSLRASADQLYHEARTDALTGLGNRLALDEHLSTTIDHLRRSPDDERAPLAVLYLDVDHFKRFNDALGHATGDGLLVEVARRITEELGDAAYRTGGDEFVAVVSGVDAPGADALAAAVLSRFDERVVVGDHEMTASVSIGVSAWPGGDDEGREPPTSAELLRGADLALYRSKELGRGRAVAFDPALARRAELQHRLRQGLQHAAERGELEVHLEPVADLVSHRVVGVTARLHWNSAEFGLLGPDVVIPIASEGGLLSATTGALLDEVGRILVRTRHAGGVDGDELWVGLALSHDQLVHPAVGELLVSCLDRPGVDPHRLHVDITEENVVDPTALESVAAMHQLGAHVTVEHFGTGPSSLLRLSHYPASTIRVDRSFVEGLGRRRGDTVIVTAIAELADRLDLALSADGIDEEFQAARLRGIGFRDGRGRLFGNRVELEALLSGTVGAPR